MDHISDRKPAEGKPYYHVIVTLIIIVLVATPVFAGKIREFQPNILYGGRAVSIAVSPANSDEILVASETGGLFKSVNRGLNWSHVDSLPSYTVWDIAYSPEDPNIVIAVISFDHRGAQPLVWRSEDAGTTWAPVPSSQPASSRCTEWSSAYSVSFEPGSTRVFVGTDCGLLTSSDQGKNWSLVLVNPSAAINENKTQDMVWTVLAQRGGVVNVANYSGLWYSNDAGISWHLGTSNVSSDWGYANHGFAASPFNPKHIFFAGEHPLQLLSSIDGGKTWQYVRSLGDNPSSRRSFVRTALASKDTFWVYTRDGAGVVRCLYQNTASGPLLKNNCSVVIVDHADPADVAFDPFSSDPLLLATDGGLHRPTVSFKAYNGQFIAAEDDGSGAVNANRSQVGSLESFVLEDINGGRLISGDIVHIKTSKSNRDYVVAEGGGGGVVKANRDKAREWETFVITRINGTEEIREGDQVALKAYNGQYVVAEGGGGSGVKATSTQIGPWETFTLGPGVAWFLTGSGPGGYNALQVTEMTGQWVSVQPFHHHLYFGTQDNSLWASEDGGKTWPYPTCCEGFHLRTLRVATNDSEPVTGVNGGGNAHFISGPHFENVSKWPDPTGGKGDTPFLLLQHGHYIQKTDNSGLAEFMVTKDSGATWHSSFSTNHETRGVPAIVGTDLDPIVYHSLRLPGLTTKNGFEKIGLVQASNIYGTGIVSNADGNGTGISLGYTPTMFTWYTVFGVDPQNPQYIIAPDVETLQMKFSRDSGQNWQIDQNLTKMVTSGGKYRFVSNGPFPLVSSIAFDPQNPCVVLLGTRQNGIFFSLDRGYSWTKLDGSDVATNLTSFYFPSTGASQHVYASTYGRGLWEIDIDRTVSCGSSGHQWRPPDFVPITIFDPRSGFRVPVKDLFDPDKCPRCKAVLVKNGRITNVRFKDSNVVGVDISGGSIYEFDMKGKELSPEISNGYSTALGDFGHKKLLRSLASERTPIRGLLIEKGQLKSVIISDKELPFKVGAVPYIKLFSETMIAGIPVVESGGKITIRGEGFRRVERNVTPIRVLLRGKLFPIEAAVQEDGRFTAEFTIKELPGDYELTVEQGDGKRLSRDTSRFKVIIEDK